MDTLVVVALAVAALVLVIVTHRTRASGAQVSASQYADIARFTSSARQLPPKRDVPTRFLDPAQLTAVLVQQYNTGYLPIERETDQKMLETLGIVQPGQSVYQTLLDILEEQAVGVYDQDTDTLYLTQKPGGIQKSTYAHEYTHALHDQYFNLDTLQPKQSDNDDRDLAVLAVLEGDASLAQQAWNVRFLTPQEGAEIASHTSNVLASAPLYVREQITFPYAQGSVFVQQLLQAGGYDAVNAALSSRTLNRRPKCCTRKSTCSASRPVLCNYPTWQRRGSGNRFAPMSWANLTLHLCCVNWVSLPTTWVPRAGPATRTNFWKTGDRWRGCCTRCGTRPRMHATLLRVSLPPWPGGFPTHKPRCPPQHAKRARCHRWVRATFG